MRLPKITNKWLWIAFAIFATMLSLTFFKVSSYYPFVKTYFDNSMSLSARNLVARSRGYLLETVELISDKNYSTQQKEQAQENLDIAYSLIDIQLYKDNFQCTTQALQDIDNLYQQLQQEKPDLKKYVHTTLPIIYCAEDIQRKSNQVRADLANKMLDDITYQLRLMILGTILFLGLCIAFLQIHKKQRQLLTKNRVETHRWIKNAMEDALTGAKNRRALDIALVKYATKKQAYSLLMCDIDFFKKYNDKYGHQKGDKVLRDIADSIKGILREQDTLFRYGGEELTIILDRTDKELAFKIAQRILKAVQDLAISHPDSEHNIVTISIGCASSNEMTDKEKNLVKLADERLYVAKHEGRNCIAY